MVAYDPITNGVLVRIVGVDVFNLVAFNDSGVDIGKGNLVYFSGFDATNDCPEITKAQANDPATTAMAVATEAIPNGNTGIVNTNVTVNGVDTSARAVGDIAYLSATVAGTVQWTAPVAAGHVAQEVGIVRTVANPGDIFYFPGLGYETKLPTAALEDASVTHAKVADDAIEDNNIKDGEVVHSKLADDSVEAHNIKNGEVGHVELADNAVEDNNIKDGEVVHSKLADDAVEAHNIKDANVTEAKLGVGAVKIAKALVTHNGGAVQTVFAIPIKAFILDVWAFCIETFSGGTETIDIGLNGGDTDGYLADAKIGKAAGNISGESGANRGALLWDPVGTSPIKPYYNAGGTIEATCTNLVPGGAGELGVFVTYALAGAF